MLCLGLLPFLPELLTFSYQIALVPFLLLHDQLFKLFICVPESRPFSKGLCVVLWRLSSQFMYVWLGSSLYEPAGSKGINLMQQLVLGDQLVLLGSLFVFINLGKKIGLKAKLMHMRIYVLHVQPDLQPKLFISDFIINFLFDILKRLLFMREREQLFGVAEPLEPVICWPEPRVQRLRKKVMLDNSKKPFSALD